MSKSNATNSNLTSTEYIRLDDHLAGVDLSIERALDILPEPARHNYEAMYEWFSRQNGTIGSREHGRRLPGVDKDFAHSAQRGIHAPNKKWFGTSGRQYAATITASTGSLYDESGTGEPFFEMDDGTWILIYSAHRNNTEGETTTTWNDALVNNLRDGVPVGVFRQVENNSNGYMRALAYVEDFDPTTGVFTLHGPITQETEQAFKSPLLGELEGDDKPLPSAEELEKDSRQFARVLQAKRTGQGRFREKILNAYGRQCALSGCGIEDVLQAAHIIDFRGEQTNIVQNGILLREDIHTLYDRSQLSIDPSSLKVRINPKLKDSEYETFRDKTLRLPDDASLQPNKKYLEIHHRKFLEVLQAS